MWKDSENHAYKSWICFWDAKADMDFLEKAILSRQGAKEVIAI